MDMISAGNFYKILLDARKITKNKLVHSSWNFDDATELFSAQLQLPLYSDRIYHYDDLFNKFSDCFMTNPISRAKGIVNFSNKTRVSLLSDIKTFMYQKFV